MPSRMDFILKAVYKKKYNFRAMLWYNGYDAGVKHKNLYVLKIQHAFTGEHI